MTFEAIAANIAKRVFSPVYFLTGEEPYFIDELASRLENGILKPEDREFNQTVVYGTDITPSALVDLARRYPMFAEHQVIIVREAQELKNIEQLQPYVEKPVPTTILVLCYKYRKLDKRKGFARSLQAGSVFFESKKLFDNQLPDWITAKIRSKGYTIDPTAALVLTEHVGADLARLVQESNKLMMNLSPGSAITTGHIEQFTGISKEYNVFELQKAIGEKNILKANKIVYHFAANPKENPIQMIIPLLFSYFSKLLLYHTLPDKKDKAAVARAMGINPYFMNDYLRAAGNYSPARVTGIISLLREYDLRSKGVNNDYTEDTELVREMLYRMMH